MIKVAVYGDSLLTVVHSTPILIIQVGNNFVVDASQEEEGCASSRLSLAVNHSGHTVTVTKDGSGGIPFGKLHNAITVSCMRAVQALRPVQQPLVAWMLLF